MVEYNRGDLSIWENLFKKIPEENWKTAPPSLAMEACLVFFTNNGVENVLDIGCGPGRWSIYFAKNGLRVKGYDFSENAVRIAREWAASEGLSADFACRPITAVPFPGEKFGGIVAALILDCVSPDEMVTGISTIRDSLTDGGYCFALFNPNRSEEQFAMEIADENPTFGVTQVGYTDAEIIAAFSDFEFLGQDVFEAEMRGFYFRK